MATFATGLDKDRHHDIFEKVIGTVIMLPSESSGVIVNHEDAAGLRVSCIIKSTVRKAVAQWYGSNSDGRWLPDPKEFELATPTMLYSSVYGYPRPGTPPLAINDEIRRHKTGQQVALVTLNDKSEDRIMVKPYRIGNVYDAGNICWGANAPPSNLREAHNLFWSSAINMDFGGPKHEGTGCTNVTHQYHDHNLPHMVHRHEHVRQCDKTVDCKHDNKQMLMIHGPWKDGKSPNIRCRNCRGLLIDSLTEDFRKIMREHESLCICCIGWCSKETGCTCFCNCCRRGCGCRCQCDLTDEFIKQMQKYEKRLESVSWEDWTRLICGRKWNQDKADFFSYNGSCDAIFVSYDEDLIKKVGKEHTRKHASWDAVIGLAKITSKGWEIDLGTHKFNLGKKKVIPLADKWESPEQRKERESREYAAQQEVLRRQREEQRRERQERERERREREEARGRALAVRIERGEVSERESAANLWRRFYLNENNSSWWQAPESLIADPATSVEVVRTWTG